MVPQCKSFTVCGHKLVKQLAILKINSDHCHFWAKMQCWAVLIVTTINITTKNWMCYAHVDSTSEFKNNSIDSELNFYQMTPNPQLMLNFLALKITLASQGQFWYWLFCHWYLSYYKQLHSFITLENILESEDQRYPHESRSQTDWYMANH